MTKNVSMYYANLTNIDLAMFLPTGQLRGDSFNLHVTLSGQEDPQEAVLIDFSTAKKRIKKWIDDHEGNGFDHKCWVTMHPEMNIEVKHDRDADRVCITTPFTEVEAPTNCFHFLNMYQSHLEQDAFTLPNIMYFWESAISEYIQEKFKQDGERIEVEVKLTNNFSYPAFANSELTGFQFRYTHGLKHSTSFGCQNPVHGHLSYIAFEERESMWGTSSFWPGSRGLYADDLQPVIDTLNNAVFIWQENVVHQDDKHVVVEYDCPRGKMRQVVRDQDAIILPIETTVEHLAEFVAERFRTIFQDMGIARIYVSEGLEKGGIAEVDVHD